MTLLHGVSKQVNICLVDIGAEKFNKSPTDIRVHFVQVIRPFRDQSSHRHTGSEIIQHTSKITYLHKFPALFMGRIRTPDMSLTKQAISNDRHLAHSAVAQDRSSETFILSLGKYHPPTSSITLLGAYIFRAKQTKKEFSQLALVASQVPTFSAKHSSTFGLLLQAYIHPCVHVGVCNISLGLIRFKAGKDCGWS